LCVQTCHPDILIVVDGDPATGAVVRMLREIAVPKAWKIIYVPSNFANQPYQRYVGWKVAVRDACRVLLYLDDDLRIHQPDAVEKTVAPLFADNDIVGITSVINFGDLSKLPDMEMLVERDHLSHRQSPWLVRLLGSTHQMAPGRMSPTGQRTSPARDGREYEPMDYLRGGVMAFRMSALSDDCFSPDLFSMAQRGWGMGEDIVLFRRVATRGQLCLAWCAQVDHPYDDPPRCFPAQAYRFGFTVAYSRRLMNESYRGFAAPTWSDRLILLKSYVGNLLLNWYRAFRNPKRFRFAYAWGYTVGAFRGLIQKPSVAALTPGIDWRQAVSVAVAPDNVQVIKKEDGGQRATSELNVDSDAGFAG
jgi:hypothetical protein